MRDIETILKKIKFEVPVKWDMRKQFFDAIEAMMASTRWSAPEIRYIRFERLAILLEDYLCRPDNEWKQKIWKIFNGDI